MGAVADIPETDGACLAHWRRQHWFSDLAPQANRLRPRNLVVFSNSTYSRLRLRIRIRNLVVFSNSTYSRLRLRLRL